MFKIVIYLFLTICLLSCRQADNKSLSASDTTAIFNSILENKALLKETINVDTLYFLKTQFYNKSWPRKSKYFKIVFLEDSPRFRMINIGGINYPYDKRERISVYNFVKILDTVSVSFVENGSQLFYFFKLIEKNDRWNIVAVDNDIGGRRKSYDFEKEQWYIDLKKKVKHEEPMFPPAKPER